MKRAVWPLAAIAVVSVLAFAPAAGGQASACFDRPYPGDAASKEEIAGWMARRMEQNDLPRELPVMAALVESGMRNLPPGDADSAGYFQMRMPIWNTGAYAGYPENPELQVKWFIDQARAARQRALAAGRLDFGSSPGQFGEWVADVERPPEQYRGRYQPRYDEAHGLTAFGCEPPPGAPPAPGEPDILDVSPPALRVSSPRVQYGLTRRAVKVTVRCDELCRVRSELSFSLPGASKLYKVRSRLARLEPRVPGRVDVRLPARTMRALKARLKRVRSVKAKLVVRVSDIRDNRRSVTKDVKLSGF